MKGKYEIYIYQPTWYYIAYCEVYVDGTCTGRYRGSGASNSGSVGLQKVGEIDFPTTAEHTVTLRNTDGGQLFWDYVLFEPVK